MAIPSEYLERAASYIGISGTDNIFNTWYWGFPCYDPDYYPWCATFQSYVGVKDLGMPFAASASAAGVAWQGREVEPWDVQPGDWVLFNWDNRPDFGWADHIGVVEWSDINGSGYFGTIEGNTGDAWGGEVMRQTRSIYNGYAVKFFRPPFEEDDMAADQVWNYGLQGPNANMPAGQRLVDIQAKFYDTNDYSGRGKDGSNFIQRICWMAAKQEKQNDLLVAIAEKVGIPEKEARKMLEVEPPKEPDSK